MVKPNAMLYGPADRVPEWEGIPVEEHTDPVPLPPHMLARARIIYDYASAPRIVVGGAPPPFREDTECAHFVVLRRACNLCELDRERLKHLGCPLGHMPCRTYQLCAQLVCPALFGRRYSSGFYYADTLKAYKAEGLTGAELEVETALTALCPAYRERMRERKLLRQGFVEVKPAGRWPVGGPDDAESRNGVMQAIATVGAAQSRAPVLVKENEWRAFCLAEVGVTFSP